MKGSADAYPFRTLPAPSRFSIAIGLVAIVFLIDQSAGELIDEGSQFLLLGTAVGATAWFAGTGPALLATVLGAILGATSGSDRDTGAVALHLALFLVHGLILTGVVDELRVWNYARGADEIAAAMYRTIAQERGLVGR